MSQTDPIADMLTRVRNAILRKKESVVCPSSKLKLEIARILKENGFIDSYEFIEKNGKTFITIYLKYFDGMSAISGLKRDSTPGQRLYREAKKIRNTKGSNKCTIVSTSRGVMTAAQAHTEKTGGEIICTIW